MTLIEQTINQLYYGECIRHRNLCMFPLISEEEYLPFYLTLEQALESGQASVIEVSEQGCVPDLLFKNECDKPVLLLDGEELVGAKQNRMLNLSLLVPAQTTMTIPVTCVEAGRWHRTTETFSTSDHVQYSRVRASKLHQVTESMRYQGARSSEQSRVWQDISQRLDDLDVDSSTSCASDMFEKHAGSVEEYVSALEPVAGQRGAAFSINDKVVGLELFDSPDTYYAMSPKIIRSYALDSLASKPSSIQVMAVMVRNMLRDVASSHVEQFKAIGMGNDLRLTTSEHHGAALEAEGRIVHLCAFSKTQTESGGRKDNDEQSKQKDRESFIKALQQAYSTNPRLYIV